MSTDNRLLLIILLFITLLSGQTLHLTTAQVTTYDTNSSNTKPNDAAIETGMLLLVLTLRLFLLLGHLKKKKKDDNQLQH